MGPVGERRASSLPAPTGGAGGAADRRRSGLRPPTRITGSPHRPRPKSAHTSSNTTHTSSMDTPTKPATTRTTNAAVTDSNNTNNTSRLTVGARVTISGVKKGLLLYYGRTHFAQSGDWCGIKLDENDGKHDGMYEGVRYFTCHPNHGIFAPASKVELLEEENGDTNGNIDTKRKPASAAGTTTKKVPTSVHNRSSMSGIPKGPSANTGSKLMKPKAIVKPMGSPQIEQSASLSTGKPEPTQPVSDSTNKKTGSQQKIQSLQTTALARDKTFIVGKSTAKHEIKKSAKAMKKPSKLVTSSKLKGKALHVDNNNTSDMDSSTDTIEGMELLSPSRVAPKEAMVLAYVDDDDDDEDIDKVSKVRSKPKHSSKKTCDPSLNIAPGSLLFTDTRGKRRKSAEPTDSGGEAMSESENEEDDQTNPMTMSQVGLLSASMIGNAFCEVDAELDQDDEMTSSTLSGNDDSRMGFDSAKTTTHDSGNCDDDMFPAKIQLATAAVSQYASLVRESSLEREKLNKSTPDASRVSSESNLNRTFSIGSSGTLMPSESNGDFEVIQREAEKLCAEIQADTVSSESKVGLKPDTTVENISRSPDIEDGSSQEELTQVNSNSSNQEHQLLADLSAGHVRQPRPLSIVSTDSTDTGIADMLSPRGERQLHSGNFLEAVEEVAPDHHRGDRPVSTVSTCSADTGIMSDYGRPLSIVSNVSTISSIDQDVCDDDGDDDNTLLQAQSPAPLEPPATPHPLTCAPTSATTTVLTRGEHHQHELPPPHTTDTTDPNNVTQQEQKQHQQLQKQFSSGQSEECVTLQMSYPTNPLQPVLNTENEDWDMDVNGSSSADTSMDEDTTAVLMSGACSNSNAAHIEAQQTALDSVNSNVSDAEMPTPSATEPIVSIPKSSCTSTDDAECVQSETECTVLNRDSNAQPTLTAITSTSISTTTDAISTPAGSHIQDNDVEMRCVGGDGETDGGGTEENVLCYREVLQPPQMNVLHHHQTATSEHGVIVHSSPMELSIVQEENSCSHEPLQNEPDTEASLSGDVVDVRKMYGMVEESNTKILDGCTMSESVCKDEGPGEKHLQKGDDKNIIVDSNCLLKPVEFVVGDSEDTASDCSKGSKAVDSMNLKDVKKAVVEKGKKRDAHKDVNVKNEVNSSQKVQKRIKPNEKVSKNAANRRKASIVDGKLTKDPDAIEPDAKKPSVKSSLLSRRASMPPKFDAATRSITVRPVLQDDRNKRPGRVPGAMDVTKKSSQQPVVGDNKVRNVKSKIGSIDNKQKTSTSKTAATSSQPKTNNATRRSIAGSNATSIASRNTVQMRRSSIATVPSATTFGRTTSSNVLSHRLSSTNVRPQHKIHSAQSSLSNSRVSSASELSGGGSEEAKRTGSNKRASSGVGSSLATKLPASTLKPPSGMSSLSRGRSTSAGSDTNQSTSPSSGRTANAITKRRSIAGPLVTSTPKSKTTSNKTSDTRRTSLASTAVNKAASKTGKPSTGSVTSKNTNTTAIKRPPPKTATAPASRSGTTSRSSAAPAPHAASAVPSNKLKDKNRASSSDEICRLEALCEARTKQLNYACMHLKQGAAGFQAMTVLVQYLSHELDAFSCPSVKSSLESVKKQLSAAQSELAALQANKESLEVKLATAIRQHEEQMAEAEQRCHQLQQQSNQLIEEHKEEMHRAIELHEQELCQLKASQEREVEELSVLHQEAMEQQEILQKKKVQMLELEQQDAQEKMQMQHEENINRFAERFEGVKQQLIQQIDTLHNECAMLQNREAEHAARCQREADLRVEQAEVRFKHLPDEIDSLKAVLEMKTTEVKEMRTRYMEQLKQLEKIPSLEEEIKSLKYKNENLQAIVDMKAEYERTLSDKHQQLLRRCDREHKENKRLSMNIEELNYMMSQSEYNTESTGQMGPLKTPRPKSYHRQISRSPPNTPDATRRKHSSMPPQGAGNMPTSPKSNGGEATQLPHSPRVHDVLPSPRTPSFADVSPRSPRSPRDKNFTSLEFDTVKVVKKPRHIEIGFDEIPVASAKPDSSSEGGVAVVNSEEETAHSVPASPSATSPHLQSLGPLKRSGTYDLLDQDFSPDLPQVDTPDAGE